MKGAFTAAALLLTCQVNVAGATELLSNGDFETGDFSSWTLFTTAGGDLSSTGVPGAPQVTLFDTNGDSVATQSAQFSVGELPGTHVAGNQQGGGIYQSFSSSGGLLDISVDIAAGGDQNTEGGVFSLLLDSVVLDSFTTGTASSDFIRSTLTATGIFAAGLHELRILITRPFEANTITLQQYVDNASVTEASSTVPAPSALALLVLGLVGLGYKRRKEQ